MFSSLVYFRRNFSTYIKLSL